MTNKWALGPSKWGRVNYLLPYRKRFQESAEAHDLYYSLWGTEKDRQEADEVFLYWCAEASGNNIIALFFACFYYLSVAFFWHYFFNYK